jgi:chromosomal replication initiator protein
MEQTTDRNTWDRVLGKIETRVNALSFKTWFRPTHLVSEDDGSLRIRVPNSWFAEWLQTNYLPVIQDVLREIERPGLAVEFIHDRGGARATAPPPPALSPDTLPGWLNPRYTFDNFVSRPAISSRMRRRGGRGAAVARLQPALRLRRRRAREDAPHAGDR